MGAITQNSVGGPDVLVTAELPDPTPQAGGVLASLLNVNDAARADASSRDIRVERMSVVPDRPRSPA
ncbi:hypothetical protein [Mesorhizobium sp. B2-7-3]|uniref:hypothetical protein n=1 Tax=Mesorhizobium sp. B2-7-3 TaxID=2589907 RepID=UPI001FEF2804|nr:hypothetical protein [Mesorhizobium sp. B2-7-3]